MCLLDNFYATGGNSADGHQWLTQASETDYTYWPGYEGRSYPYDGDDPMADAARRIPVERRCQREPAASSTSASMPAKA